MRIAFVISCVGLMFVAVRFVYCCLVALGLFGGSGLFGFIWFWLWCVVV